MDIPEVKKEVAEEQIVKIEGRVKPEVTTVVLQNISEFGEVDEQIVSAESLPYILKGYRENSDGNLQIAQVDDGQYTYIIETPEGFEEGTEFELADGEHYVIEEYQGNYEETSQDSEYETVYVQQEMDTSEQDTEEVETSEVYTISEEIEGQYSEDDPVTEEDDQQMAIVEETEVSPEEHVREEKPLTTIIHQENLQVQIKQAIKPQRDRTAHTKPKIKTEIKADQPEQDDQDGGDMYVGNVLLADDTTILEEVDGEEQEEEEDGKELIDGREDTIGNHMQLVYECSICGKGFKTASGVTRHISVSHWKPQEENFPQDKVQDVLAFSLCPCCGEPSDSAHTAGDFKCTACDKLFNLRNSLERHISIEHPSGDSYECVDCKKNFALKEQLIDHTRVHSLKSVKCPDCGREFTRKYHLDRHIGQTGCMGLPKQVYECRVCSKSFTRKDNLAEHLKAHAGIMNRKKKKFVCEFCHKDFNGLALLNVHVRTHTGERPYGCDICEKKFPSSGAMKKHRRMHTGEKPYTCPQCGNKFAAKETLNRHWRTHTGEKPHECKYCGKSFIQAAQLRAHIFHHTGENAYTCPHCNRAFNRKLRLTTHIKFMHEGAEPLICTHGGCNKTFFRKEDIHRHLMTHSGEKPYSCEICGKSFVVKSSLKIHQMTHKKEPPVSCEVCSRAFIRQDCLMRHMRARHRDVLEDIVSNAEKKRLQKQLFQAVTSAANKAAVKDTIVWNELTLTESIKELLSLLVDEDCLKEFGHPEAPVDKVLESVIRRCGHSPASEVDFDYIEKMRENAKLLFTVVIDDQAVKELLNNQTVDEVIMHVLKLAKKETNLTNETVVKQEENDGNSANDDEDDDTASQMTNEEQITIEMEDSDEMPQKRKIEEQEDMDENDVDDPEPENDDEDEIVNDNDDLVDKSVDGEADNVETNKESDNFNYFK